MSHWRVEQHYGFGAAQIPICAEPHTSGGFGLIEGVGYLLGEVVVGGPIAIARRLVGQVPALLLVGLMFVAFVVTLGRDRSDQSPIEVVLFESLDEAALPIPEEIVEVPVPLAPPVQVAKVEPPKPRMMPKPEVVELAKSPPPPPVAPTVKPKPKPRARPRPVVSQIAKIEAPKITPAQRVERTARGHREATTRPKLKVDLAANQPKPAPTLQRMDRVARASVSRSAPSRSAPRLSAPAAPAFDQPQDAPTRQSFRVANAKPTANSRARAVPGMAAAPKYAAPSSSQREPNRRRPSAARPSAVARTRRPAPSLDRAPAPAAAAQSTPTRARASRPAPRTASRHTARPVAEMATASAPSRPTAMPALASRSGRSAPATSGSSRGNGDDRPGLAGVPLGDLAACLTDREEDRLKQAVVAAVKTQEECVSSKGTYRFIETKNLNAFLMWIDRAPSRAVSDRCVELSYALECLESASQRAAR